MNYKNTNIFKIIIILFVFSISISSVIAQKAVFSPETLYMGKIPIESKAVRILKIYNSEVASAADDLEITSIQINDPNFSILNEPGVITLTRAQQIVLYVEFSPNTVGLFDAEISVQSNTINGATTIPVSGEGISNTSTYFERIFGPVEGGGLGSFKETPDGGYILVGNMENPDEEVNDIYIVKTDRFGEIELTKTIEDEDRSQGASEIILSDDDHYIVVGGITDEGSTDSDINLLKLDLSGNIVWEKTYGGNKNDGASSLVKTSDSGYLIVGNSYSFNDGSNKDIYIIKVDQNGNEEWYKTYGDQGGGESANKVINTNDGGFAIIGNTDSKGAGGQDIWLLKLNGNCDLQWDKTFGGIDRDGGADIAEFTDGGYAIAGYSITNNQDARDIYLIGTDEVGNELWDSVFGDEFQDRATNVLIVDDGILITGNDEMSIEGVSDNSDIFLIKTDFDGTELWRKQYGGRSGEGASEMILNSENHIVILGGTGSYGNNSRVYFLNVSYQGNFLGISDFSDANHPNDFIIYSNYPNPFNSATTISYHLKNDSRVVINIYDILGHKIQTHLDSYQVAGQHSMKWDAKGLAAGTYFLEVQTKNNSLVKKMMYLK